MGVFFTIYYLGCAVLPTLAGAIYDRSGTGRVTLWMVACVAGATVPLLWLFRRATAKSTG